MKTIGLIGGMSWESTASYYKIINETIKTNLGGLHSAKCILYSVDFDEIEKHQSQGNWDECGKIMTAAAKSLERAGADFIIICTNTMHKVVPQIIPHISIPILHIAEATAEELVKNKITTVGLLGTKYTMTQEFYKERLVQKGINVVIPNEEDIHTINSVIFDELCLGIISEKSRNKYVHIIDKLTQSGAEAIVLGCTEIGMLVKQSDTNIKLFDTTLIHAVKAALTSIEY